MSYCRPMAWTRRGQRSKSRADARSKQGADEIFGWPFSSRFHRSERADESIDLDRILFPSDIVLIENQSCPCTAPAQFGNLVRDLIAAGSALSTEHRDFFEAPTLRQYILNQLVHQFRAQALVLSFVGDGDCDLSHIGSRIRGVTTDADLHFAPIAANGRNKGHRVPAIDIAQTRYLSWE